jgi:hypothetical protein
MNTEGYGEPLGIVFKDGRHNGPARTGKGTLRRAIAVHFMPFPAPLRANSGPAERSSEQSV